MNWSLIHYFKEPEFASPDAPGSGDQMNEAFLLKLDKLREAVKMPLVIQSGYRTAKHNAKVGGVDSSAHETGHAVDIAAFSASARFAIIEAALRLGFRRIGVGASFVHIDDDITKPQDVCWTYPSLAKRKHVTAPPKPEGFVT